MPFQVGPLGPIVVFVIALLVLGPKKLPEGGRSVGRGMREFKASLGGERNPAQVPAAAHPEMQSAARGRQGTPQRRPRQEHGHLND